MREEAACFWQILADDASVVIYQLGLSVNIHLFVEHLHPSLHDC